MWSDNVHHTVIVKMFDIMDTLRYVSSLLSAGFLCFFNWRRIVLAHVLCVEILTWLILPVVICLSQRLSHACLSISILLRNCEWLIKTVIVFLMATYYLDNYGNSRANTCLQTRLLGRVVLIRYLTNPGLLVLSWFIIFVRIVFWRRIIQVSDLSAFDGRVLAYRGIDG